MKAYQADIAKFEANDTQVFGLSVDSPFANAEFAKQIGVTFPILSDIKHTTVKDYGIYNEARDQAQKEAIAWFDEHLKR